MTTQRLLVSLSMSLYLAACAPDTREPEGSAADTAQRPSQQPAAIQTSPPHPASVDETSSEAIRQQASKRAIVGMALHSTADSAFYYPPSPQHRVDRERYLTIDENGVALAAESPLSTFSIDVDTAAYANVRRMLQREGRLPPHDAVRVEEMLNYFGYNYPAPDSAEQAFAIHTEMAPSPWAPQRHLLQIGIAGFEPAQEQRPAANLVFLVDVSGSMQGPDKLSLVKSSLKMLLRQLNADDRVALVVYAGAAGMVLDSTPGDQQATISSAIDALAAGGSTNGGAGITLAYKLARQHHIEGGINRVIIASDGDMNVGTVDLEQLKELVERQRSSGIGLSTLGYGRGNYNDALMEQLADIGNGNAAYIDSLREANKVLVQEMHATLLTIASDVKIQVEFNPALVAEYRLIGYENRMLEREDFKNDKVDAGEIGAGHTVTALYEVVLQGSAGSMIPDLRYQSKQQRVTDSGNELAYVKVRYKPTGEERSIEIASPVLRSDIVSSLARGSDDFRFATAVAGFGQLLRGSTYTADWRMQDSLQLARGARGSDAHGYRAELISLIELADALTPTDS